MEQTANNNQLSNLNFKDSKYATGRRKTSIAKVWLKKGSGKIFINGKNYNDYFTRETHKMKLLRTFEIINQSTDYDVRCNVKGCLLYTSQSPRDQRGSRVAASSL